jgi:hypothetical protein
MYLPIMTTENRMKEKKRKDRIPEPKCPKYSIRLAIRKKARTPPEPRRSP